MAQDSSLFVTAKESLSIQDYSSTPNNCSVALISFSAPESDEKERANASENSSTGKTLVGRSVTGDVIGTSGTFEVYARDINDNAETDAYIPLIRQLVQNDLSGGAFSGWDFDSQSDGGSKQCKLIHTRPNEKGVNHICTYPATIDSITGKDVNGFKAYDIGYTVVGAITRS